MSEGRVRFIRVNGRVVPIRDNGKGKKKQSAALGVAGVAGGGYAVSKAAPMVTGRTTLYHGTTASNAEKILSEGLKRNGNHGIGDMFHESAGIKAKDYTYMTPHKSQARAYGAQAAGLDDFVKNGQMMDRAMRRSPRTSAEMVQAYSKSPQRIKDTVLGQVGISKGKIRKASVPLWEQSFQSMMVKNPELGGAKNGAEFANVLTKRTGRPISKWQGEAYYKTLDTPTFNGDISSKYFKGAADYKKLSFGEIRRYAKVKPSRFGMGLALGAAGVAAIGAGAYALINRNK